MTDDAFQRAPFTVPKAVAGHQRPVYPPSYYEQILLLVARGREELTAFRDDPTTIQIANRDPNPVQIWMWRVDFPVRLIALRLQGFGTLWNSLPFPCTPLLRTKWHLLVIQPFGHNRHGSRIKQPPTSKVGGCCAPFRGEQSRHLTQCRLGRGLPACQVSS